MPGSPAGEAEGSLSGLRVAITRGRGQERGLAAALSAAGATVVHRPLIRIEAPDDEQPLLGAVAAAATYDWLIFTSSNAASRFTAALKSAERAVASLTGVRIAAVGPATRAALEASGLHVDLLPGEALAQAIADAMATATDLKGKRVLWPCARGAGRDLQSALERAGALVDAVEAYRTVIDTVAGAALRRDLAAGGVDVVTFTSPSTVRAFQHPHPPVPGRAVLAVIGPVTAEAARAAGLPVHVQASEHTAEGLVRALRAFIAERRT